MFSGGVVMCLHSDGSSRLELGHCDQDVSGYCVTACSGSASESSENSAPEPCKDTPLKSDRQFARVAPRLADQATLVPFVVVAVVVLWCDSPPQCGVRSPLTKLERPPDTLARLRTIVLLV